MLSSAPAYRLVRRPMPTAAAPPRLDEAQQQVVSHSVGPLLVLAGPGTGKTTAIVESVVQRIAGRGIDPARVLVLTFSRKAAEELRERITMRLGRTTRQPLALTFHSYAYALVRREFALGGDEPPTLLSGPDQLLEVRRLLRGEAEDGGRGWPERLRPALATRGFAPSCGTSCSAPPSAAWTGAGWPGSAGSGGAMTGWRLARSSSGTPAASTSRRCPPTTTRRSSGSRPGCSAAPRPAIASGRPTTRSWSTSTRTPTQRRRTCCTRWPGTA